jgi:hypothetical protein
VWGKRRRARRGFLRIAIGRHPHELLRRWHGPLDTGWQALGTGPVRASVRPLPGAPPCQRSTAPAQVADAVARICLIIATRLGR